MRRFKAIYLLIILAVLWIGGGVAGWMLLITPEKELYKKAEEEWNSAKSAMQSAQQEAQASQGSYSQYAMTIIENHNRFQSVLQTMPGISNMTVKYQSSPRAGLEELYKMMGTKKLEKELSAWTKKYKLSRAPRYSFSGILGYEQSLTSVKMVMVPFGKQTFRASGYRDLVRQVQGRYGFGHCPLIITGVNGGIPGGGSAAPTTGSESGAPEGGTPASGEPTNSPSSMRMQAAGGSAPATDASGAATSSGGAAATGAAADAGGAAASAGGSGFGDFTITVNRRDPRHRPQKPALSMDYMAYGVFLTRDWDPLAESINGMTVKDYLAQVKGYLTQPPAVPSVTPASEYPLIFGFFGPRTDVQ